MFTVSFMINITREYVPSLQQRNQVVFHDQRLDPLLLSGPKGCATTAHEPSFAATRKHNIFVEN